MNDRRQFPFRLTQIALKNIRDENAFLSPLAMEKTFETLKLIATRPTTRNETNIFQRNFPFFFQNFLLIDRDSTNFEDFPFDSSVEIRSFVGQDERKDIFNEILKEFAEKTNVSLITSLKNLSQTPVEPMTLINLNSLRFRPNRCENWEKIWSLKFHSNRHIATETEFYYSKGFFPVAFDETFQKIEILGETIQNIPMKMLILLPRCSSDLVHLYANIDEYVEKPMTSAYIGVCLPKISIDSDLNLIESFKSFDDESTDSTTFTAARSIGNFTFDAEKLDDKHVEQSCAPLVDLSPVTPWIFYVNRPFLFFITYDEHFLLIGQILGTKMSKKKTIKEHLETGVAGRLF